MRRGTDWNHYRYVYGDDKPAVVHFDVEAAVVPQSGSWHGLRVYGLPDPSALETRLADVEVWLVGELHYDGRIEYVLQVEQAHVNAVNTALEGLDLAWTTDWDYFDERVCPTPADWRRIQDREALARLDLDTNGEIEVLHRFYGDAPGLDAIAERLMTEGFTEVDRQTTRMTLAHHHPLVDISTITLGLMRLCESNGVAYDGWLLPG